MKPCIAAFAATDTAIDDGVGGEADACFIGAGGGGRVDLLAVFTKDADETLREHGFER